MKSGPGPQGRTLFDRVIRACNHQLGTGSPHLDHVTHLVQLVELSLRGYDISPALVVQSSPLYMEKIIFHIVKKLSSLEVPSLCNHVADMLYNRIILAQKVCFNFSYIIHLYICFIYYFILCDCFSVSVLTI